MAGNVVKLLDLRMVTYGESMRVMNTLLRQKLDLLKTDKHHLPEGHLILCENHPVYTIGVRRKSYNIDSEIKKLSAVGAPLELTNRGGLITYHGPGQLIAYPILNLKNYPGGISCFVHRLEDVTIQTCQHFGIDARRTDDVGAWIEDRKIASIGLHSRRYITSHGLSLNCNVDLSWYDHISACGLEGKEATSISKEINKTVEINDVKPILCKQFEKIFDVKLKEETNIDI